MLEFDLHVRRSHTFTFERKKERKEREHQSGSQSHILIEMLLLMMGSRNTRSIDICMRDEKSQLDLTSFTAFGLVIKYSNSDVELIMNINQWQSISISPKDFQFSFEKRKFLVFLLVVDEEFFFSCEASEREKDVGI